MYTCILAYSSVIRVKIAVMHTFDTDMVMFNYVQFCIVNQAVINLILILLTFQHFYFEHMYALIRHGLFFLKVIYVRKSMQP